MIGMNLLRAKDWMELLNSCPITVPRLFIFKIHIDPHRYVCFELCEDTNSCEPESINDLLNSSESMIEYESEGIVLKFIVMIILLKQKISEPHTETKCEIPYSK